MACSARLTTASWLVHLDSAATFTPVAPAGFPIDLSAGNPTPFDFVFANSASAYFR
jgi:hypothetical protein